MPLRPLPVLPQEIWCDIFDYFHVFERGDFLRVSKEWNTTLLSSPHIWRTVKTYTWDGQKRVTRLSGESLLKILGLSANADLRLMVLLTDDDAVWRTFITALDQNLHRCTHISVIFNEWFTGTDTDDDARRLTTEALCQPAPRLRTLDIIDHLAQFNNHNNAARNVLGGQAPMLSAAKMQVNIGRMYGLALSNLRSLLYSSTETWTVFTLNSIFLACPRLELLVLDLYNLDVFIFPEESAVVATPPTLREVTVICNEDSNDPIPFVRLFSYHKIPRIWTWCSNLLPDAIVHELLERAVEDIAPLKVLCMEIAGRTDTFNFDFYAPTCDPLRVNELILARVVLESQYSARPDFAFKFITHLYLGEMAFCVSTPLPEAPNLTFLHLQILSPMFQGSDGQDSVFMLPRTRERVFRCPSLETMRLASRWNDFSPTRLGPDVIAEFIEYHLDLGQEEDRQRRLPTLMLLGARITEHHVDACTHLLGLVDKVEVQPGFMSWAWDDHHLPAWDF